MNGTSGFQEVQSSTSRSSSYRFQHEQWHQFGTGFLQEPLQSPETRFLHTESVSDAIK